MPTVYMKASVGYLNGLTGDDTGHKIAAEFVPFIDELVKTLVSMDPEDDFVLSCSFVKKNEKIAASASNN